MKTRILFLLLLLALSACSRRISERIAVHDTLRVALTDTLREHIMLTDSVLIHDTCYVENGVATRFRLVDRGDRRTASPKRATANSTIAATTIVLATPAFLPSLPRAA